MRTLQSCVTLRSKNRDRKARWRARKEELRIERSVDDPVRGEWRGRHAITITVHDRISGELHSLDFYLSQKRVNSYRVTMDGKPWKEQVSASAALVGVRKALPKFSLHY